MVLSTHDLNLAAALCRRLVLLQDGRVLAQGPTERRAHRRRTSARSTASTPTCSSHARAGHLTVVPIARPTDR